MSEFLLVVPPGWEELVYDEVLSQHVESMIVSSNDGAIYNIDGILANIGRLPSDNHYTKAFRAFKLLDGTYKVWIQFGIH